MDIRAEKEYEIDKDALYEALDQAGGFVKNPDGSLEQESLIKLRRIVISYVQAMLSVGLESSTAKD